MKAFFGFLASLFFFVGVMFSAFALSDDSPGADDMALTDNEKKAGLFDHVPGIAGCCDEFTSSFCPSSSSSSSGEGGDGDGGGAAAAVVAGTMTLLHSVRFEQPTVRASSVSVDLLL